MCKSEPEKRKKTKNKFGFHDNPFSEIVCNKNGSILRF